MDSDVDALYATEDTDFVIVRSANRKFLVKLPFKVKLFM